MLNYFKDIGLGIVTVLNSMWVACRHFFTPSVTLQYPTEKWTMRSALAPSCSTRLRIVSVAAVRARLPDELHYSEKRKAGEG